LADSGDRKRYGTGQMSNISTDSRLQYFPIGAILLVHLLMVPIAINLTLYVYGFTADLSINNQRTWTPIIKAQSSLLVIYFAFGSGRSYVRGGLFGVGMIYLVMSYVWAHSKLLAFPPQYLKSWIAQSIETSIWLLLPAVLSSILLLPMRGILGSIQCKTTERNKCRFSIAELMVITFIVAAVLGWYHFVTTDYMRRAHPIGKIAINHALAVLCAIGCMIFLMSRYLWWLGIFVFVASLISLWTYWLPTRDAGFTTWYMMLYPWIIVLTTLLGYRLIGYRLLGFNTAPNIMQKDSEPPKTRELSGTINSPVI
jgi:hypothetical protein